MRVQKATQLASNVKSELKGEKQSLPTRCSHSTAILNQANKSEFSTIFRADGSEVFQREGSCLQ